MIDKKELRIGNWVAYGDNHYQIEAILKRNDNYALCFKGLHHGVWIDSAGPIELTEEILLKCGFKECQNGFEFEPACFWISSDFKECNYIHPIYSFELKYLHELQNLIFALTGKEVEYEKD